MSPKSRRHCAKRLKFRLILIFSLSRRLRSVEISDLHGEGATYADDDLPHVVVDPDEEGSLPDVHVVGHVDQLYIFLVAHLKRNVQVGFFNCSAQISVLKRKTLFNQRGSSVNREFHGTESLIGCPSFFILVRKIGRNS